MTTADSHVEVRISSAAPRITLSLRASPWNDLRDFARESADGRETAGFAFGPHVRSWHRRVSISWVTSMVKERAASSCAFDIASLVQEKASIRGAEADGHVGEIGSWHTHPNSQSGRPSDTDLSTWLNAHDFLGSPYVGLILTAHVTDERWSRPDIHAWITRRGGTFDRPICERALVEVDGVPR